MKGKNAILLLAAGLLLSASASITDDVIAVRDGRNAAVRPGVWHADLNKARAYAEANGLPLVAVWSNGDECAHCVAFENCIMSPAFRNWMKDSGIVFYFGVRPDPYDGQEGYHGTSFFWCCMNQNATMAWPYVRVYWPKGGVDQAHSGAWYDGEDGGYVMRCSYSDNRTDLANFIAPGDYNTYNPGGRRIISVLVGTRTATAVMPVGGGVADGGLLNGFDANTYAGGEFGFTYHPLYPDGGIQVEYGTDLTVLAVPLTRKNTSAQTKASYNWLRTVYPNGRAETNKVDWAAGAAETSALVKLDKSWLEGESKLVTLELYSDKVELMQTSYAFCVDKVPNSPSNPLFVGERTKDTLQWGEWTMDVGAAMQKVSEAGGNTNNAYVLVVCGGALWCPDCANTDKNLFDQPEFKTWATSTHKVALVAIDIPNMRASSPEGTSACLLTSTIGQVSSGYLTATGKDSTGTYQCGVNYQSRHGVTLAQAAQVYARNKSYAAGLLNKLVPSNPYRPGVPTIYALRPDGTVAGRIAEFASTSPKAWNANYLTRLDELLALVDDADEERGNGLCADKNPVISGSSKRGVTATLSLADETDVYRLNTQKDSELMLVVSGTDAARVAVSVLDGGDDTVVATTTGTLSSGMMLSCTIPSTNCYIRVSTADANYFQAAKAGSTVVSYTLRTDSVIAPGEVYDETDPIDCSGGCLDLGDASTNAWVKLEQGVQYKFVGLADDNATNEAALDYDAATGIYTAKVSGDTLLMLSPDADGMVVFGYQRWVMGMVEFYPKAQTVKERGDTEEQDYVCTINVRRTGGVSGWAGARVTLVAEDSTRNADSFEWNDGAQTLVWGEGDDGVRTVSVKVKGDTHADGTTKLTFKLEPVADDGAGHACTVPVDDGEFVLTVVDDDEAVPGRVALTTAGGMDIPASRTVVAKGGAAYALGLKRLDGSDGPLEVKVVLDGTNEVATATWETREGLEKDVPISIDLPAYAEGSPNKVSVSIAGVDGAKVVAAQKYLTISILPDDAAMFAAPSAAVADLTRYVGHDVVTVELDKATITGSDVQVVKLSGSIAPGLTWSGLVGASDCSPGTPGLEITGTPTKGGTYTAVFQVVQDGVAGGTVQLTMTVADPVEASDSEAEALNPHLSTTRTVPDIMVVDVDKERLIGLLTVTVPRNGRLSGKYRSILGETIPLLATEWDSCTTTGDFTATMTDVDGDGYSAVVTAKADGTIDVAFTDPATEFEHDKLACLAKSSLWSDGDGAVAWKGYYTVSLPFKKQAESSTAFANGDGYVTLKMTDDAAVKSGRMLYAGVLANGKAFSGTATLEQDTDSAALLPVFAEMETDTFTGVFSIDQTKKYREVEAYENGCPYWQNRESFEPYDGKLAAYGCLYDSNSVLQCCVNTFATQYLTFFAQPEKLVDNEKFGTRASHYADFKPKWSTNNVYAVAVKVTNEGGSDSISLYSPDVARQSNGLTLNFNPATGLVSGQLWLDFFETATTGKRVVATYRGIVKPGWGKIPDFCNTCIDEPTPQEAPFISGTCFFPDTYEFEYKMQRRWLPIKRGCPFSIGIEPGQ